MRIRKFYIIVIYTLFMVFKVSNLSALNNTSIIERNTIIDKSIPDYISIYSDYTMDLMKKYNMPASIILAQGILESDAGTSDIAISFNNHFNILCDNTLPKDNCYKDFENPVESFENHVLLMKRNAKYNSLFEKKAATYNEWAYGLAQFGDKSETYVKMIIYYIEKYRIYNYDLQVTKEIEQDKQQAEKVRKEQLELKKQEIKKDSITNSLKDKKENIIVAIDSVKTVKEDITLDNDAIQNQEAAVDNTEETQQNEDADSNTTQENNDKLEEVATTHIESTENTSPNIYESQYYIVQPKDTYYSIAKRYGISVRFLKELNSATSNLIIIGQSLKVVGNLPDYRIHNIVKDDTLYNIANRYGVTIAYLKTINNIGDDNLIYIGDELKY